MRRMLSRKCLKNVLNTDKLASLCGVETMQSNVFLTVLKVYTFLTGTPYRHLFPLEGTVKAWKIHSGETID